jgi:alpha,alpha-trehalase
VEPAHRDNIVRLIRHIPNALKNDRSILRQGDGKRFAVFLDYDGTLAPIADTPALAILPEKTRTLLEALKGLCPIAILSGRDLQDLIRIVGVKGITYAGSHGFDIMTPLGKLEQKRWRRFLLPLDQAAEELTGNLRNIPGVLIERKRYAVAVHYRLVKEVYHERVKEVFNGIAARHSELMQSSGKKLFELRPRVDWNKGEALLFLLRKLNVHGQEFAPIYIGDDETDEEAFRAMRPLGVGIVVGNDKRLSEATYRLNDTGEVARFLRRLIRLERAKTERTSDS